MAVIIQAGHERRLSGTLPQTSTNLAELVAAIEAIESLDQPCRVTIQTESRYLRDGACTWLPAWVRKGWVDAKGKPSPNSELWKRLAAAIQPHRMTWKLLRTHAGHPLNELADAVCIELLRNGRSAA